MQRVSILVPMYGVEHYIEQCARSLFAQSYPFCEFIFVDDGSKDQSLATLRSVAAEYPELTEQIRIVELAQNGGVATARNAALDCASGEYIIFVDADDWVDSTIVEQLMLRTTECDAQICNAWCRGVEASGKSRNMPERWLKSRKSHIKAILGQSHIVPNHIRGMLICRSIFEDNHLRFTPSINFGEDYSLLPQIIYSAQRLATLNQYLYFYRLENEGSYMNNIGARHIEEYVAAQRIVSDFIEQLPDAHSYDRALELGRVNIKKWIFKRSLKAKEFNTKLFGTDSPKIQSPLLRLYNTVVDGGNPHLIKIFSVVVNLPLYLRAMLRRA